MLKDCSPINLTLFAKTYFGNKKTDRARAVVWLQQLAINNWSDESYFSFESDKKRAAEPIVYCEFDGTWWTGRYVGSVTFDGVTVDIKPRFGIQFAMDNMPLVNVIAVDIDRSFGKGGQFVQYLQALLWLSQLVRAARHALPAVKMDESHESLVCRGRIDVRGTIRQRAKASDKVVSINRYKDLVNPVSVAIVLAFKEIKNWFPDHDVMHFLPPTVALRLQQMIGVIKRHSKPPSYTELSKVRLSSLAHGYKSLAVMSLDILKRKGVSEREGTQNNKTLLLDVAELWEFYLLGVLRSVVENSHASNIEIDHGTHGDGYHLLSGSDGESLLGRLLPDYLVRDADRILLIADAKYKRLGDAPWQSPKRDDLYQMTAYLNAHPECRHCVLLYPKWDSSKLSKVESNNPWVLASGQTISFVTVSPDKVLAVQQLQDLGIITDERRSVSIAG